MLGKLVMYQGKSRKMFMFLTLKLPRNLFLCGNNSNLLPANVNGRNCTETQYTMSFIKTVYFLFANEVQFFMLKQLDIKSSRLRCGAVQTTPVTALQLYT
jgi:hypothetical protein